MENIGDILLPAVEHYEALNLRGGHIFRGKLKDPSRGSMRELRAQARRFPGTLFFDEIDGDRYVTYQYYEGLPAVRWKLHVLLLAITVLTTMLAHSEESQRLFITHVAGALHELQMMVLTLCGVLVDSAGGIAVRLHSVWGHLKLAPSMMLGGAKFSAAVLGILLAHEAGHYFAARHYGMTVTPPYFLPVPGGVGTLGAIIRIRTPMLHRRSLFVIGAAGPLAGLIVAVAVLAFGIAHSGFIAESSISQYAVRARLGDSLLTAALQWLIIGPAPAGEILAVHSLRLAGWFGLIVTSINLLPVGQLDGGHIAYSLLGRYQQPFARGALLGLAALGVVGVLSVFGPRYWDALDRLPQVWPMWIFCALLIRLVMRGAHPPLVFERVPLGWERAVGALLMMLVFVVTFVPCPFDFRTILAAGQLQ